MKKRILHSLVFLLCACGAALAQPGYQGRKLSVQANLLFLPAFTNGTYHREPGLTSFNTTGEASVDYVLSKRTALGLSFRRARTSNINDYGKDGLSPVKVFSNAVGLQYRVYKRKSGNIAPLGKYFQWGAGLLLNQVRQPAPGGSTTAFRMYALRMGAGRNRILFDRLILSHGWEISHVLPASGGEGLLGATHYYKDDAQTMAQYRLWRHSILNFRVGLGFLAY
ncbi:MAG: hypothetical protein ICV83_08020 [Cytophagales bacterium]|nr:hypothetical protein [Cytophagales bacterium]